jgi:hypothetical protein
LFAGDWCVQTNEMGVNVYVIHRSQIDFQRNSEENISTEEKEEVTAGLTGITRSFAVCTHNVLFRANRSKKR